MGTPLRDSGELEQILSSGDLLVTMGAGDVGKLGERFLAGSGHGR